MYIPDFLKNFYESFLLICLFIQVYFVSLQYENDV